MSNPLVKNVVQTSDKVHIDHAFCVEMAVNIHAQIQLGNRSRAAELVKLVAKDAIDSPGEWAAVLGLQNTVSEFSESETFQTPQVTTETYEMAVAKSADSIGSVELSPTEPPPAAEPSEAQPGSSIVIPTDPTEPVTIMRRSNPLTRKKEI